MNIPRYWAKESQKILDPQGKPKIDDIWQIDRSQLIHYT